jgi:single-strand DNA-binding protein
MNVWTFSGRVGADAELRTTQSGEKVLNFRVANDIGFGDRKTTQWVDCQYWGKRAEAVSSYVRKGDKITVSGEVKLEEFQRRDGTPGSKLAVRVNDLDLAARSEGGSSQREEGGGGYDQSVNSRPPAGGGAQRGGGKPAFDTDLSDDIPF